MSNLNIPIIYYHSVAPRQFKEWSRFWLTLELRYFEEHLKFFKKNNFISLFLTEYLRLRNTNNISSKYFCLTFDDGYLDNYIYAFPLLKKYNFKATIFINPEFVDEMVKLRKTIEDYWNNKASMQDIDKWGFLNWVEMKEMEKSGLIDIQSHTLTHDKYFVSDKLLDFHHPGSDCINQIGNLFPERKPYYIMDPKFEELIPYGYPYFEEKSSVIARKVEINDDFIKECIDYLKHKDWKNEYSFRKLRVIVDSLYRSYKNRNAIISKVETEDEYEERIISELKDSKEIIEKNLEKKIDICCWPHGDNNEFVHKTALKIGYKATSLGNMHIDYLDETRFERFGLGKSINNIPLTKLKATYKIQSYREIQPYRSIKSIYEFIRKLYK